MNQRERIRVARVAWGAELGEMETAITVRRMRATALNKVSVSLAQAAGVVCESCENGTREASSRFCSYCLRAKLLREVLYDTRPDQWNDFTAHADTLVQVGNGLDGEAAGLRLDLVRLAAALVAEGNRRRQR